MCSKLLHLNYSIQKHYPICRTSSPFLVDYPCCLRIMNVWENRTDTLNGNALRNILLNIGMNHEKDFAYRR